MEDNFPPLVSVIIPTYNYGQYIMQTIENVLNQSLKNLECIIIDDGSTDNTETVINKLKHNRVHYIYKKNEGVSAARNVALREAKGKYIQFLDADDLLSPDKLLLQSAYMEANPALSLSYTGARLFYNNKEINSTVASRYKKYPIFKGSGLTILNKFIERNIFHISSPLIRRDFLTDQLIFDEGLSVMEDWDFWLKLIIAGAKFDYFPDKNAYTLIRIHPGSLSAKRKEMYNHEMMIREKIDQLLTEMDNHKNALTQEEIISLKRKNKIFGYLSAIKLGELNSGWKGISQYPFFYYIAAVNTLRYIKNRKRYGNS